MNRSIVWTRHGWLMGGAAIAALGAFAGPARANAVIQIPPEALPRALEDFGAQSGLSVIADSRLTANKHSPGVKGATSPEKALAALLSGTGLTYRHSDDSVMILAANTTPAPHAPSSPQPSVETVVVTAEKKKENIQQVPIAVTALTQQQLTERQIAGGPDLLREVPNMDFTKTNFSGYNIELRGIGTQAISVTTDPAVAVAFNDVPFIRNHFFEQEFYDLQDVEVLRGPQGTLYGRNATAGVVNLKSALPTDQYEGMVSADFGNYNNRRFEGMLNLPIAGDKLDLRIAGEWTKRDGYTEDTTLNTPVDGRDLWSGRMTLGWKPTSDLQTYFVWEHFSEDDNRLRSGKQTCETAQAPTEVDGVPVNQNYPGINGVLQPARYLDQGCLPASLYSKSAFEVPDGTVLPYYQPFAQLGAPIQGGDFNNFNIYTSAVQSTNLRQIEAAFSPIYRAKNDTLEYNANWSISPALTLTSQTGYNHDFLWSNEDYNRFDTTPGAFQYCPPSGSGTNFSCEGLGPNQLGQLTPDPTGLGIYNSQTANSALIGTPCNPLTANPAAPAQGTCQPAGVFCDPQIGCSDRLVAEDLSEERSWQFSQEFRLASNYSGPINFSFGGNFLHYETEENYYVFINTLTLVAASHNPNGKGAVTPWVPGVSNNQACLPFGYAYANPFGVNDPQSDDCSYIDPNPIGSVNGQGHNYFLSQNPYVLNSYAVFGELYYNIMPDLKLTTGLRWTEDQKHFIDIPSELLVAGYGYPATGVVNQRWDAPTGRAVLDWTPDLDFSDQTLIYGSYAHGYKAGGANPPGAALLTNRSGDIAFPDHPLTFKPEFIDAFELGTKNTFLGNALTVNGDVFYYAYQGYQISEIVDRTAINSNFNASVKGAELEANWEPIPGLRFGLTGGYENATANHGDGAVDLINRTNGAPGWMVVKPFVTQASNCILPSYVVAALLQEQALGSDASAQIDTACGQAYNNHVDPVTGLPYVPDPTAAHSGAIIPPGYPGFDPVSNDPHAPVGVNEGLGLPPNNGEGFSKNLNGNQLPNAPHFTTSLTAEYSMPVSADWVGTFHVDFYWQSQSWARILNDNPYDKIHGYSNVNVSLLLNSDNGWQVMGYVKNVFNTTAITGDFLNSDDSGLTTNIFLTDPRLYGVRVTKHLDENDGFWGGDYSGYKFFTGLFSDTDSGKPPLWIELGGSFNTLVDDRQPFDPPFMADIPGNFGSQLSPQKGPSLGLDWETKVTFEPSDSDWVFEAAVRYGRSARNKHVHHQTNITRDVAGYYQSYKVLYQPRYVDALISESESHAILDFAAGKNVGLGMLGHSGDLVVSVGARYASFDSASGMTINTVPDSAQHTTGPKYHYHSDYGNFHAKRSFHGLGPSVKAEGSTPFAGNEQNGELTFDWGVNGALLFGRQRVAGSHKTGGAYYCTNKFGIFFGRTATCPAQTAAAHARFYYRNQFGNGLISSYNRTRSIRRARMTAVPDLGGFVGLSMKYQNAKVSFGYRADEFFGAIDGGIDSYKAENRGFFGPYANISIGLGG